MSRENVGASTSHNSMGLHGLLQGQLYLFYVKSSILYKAKGLRLFVSVIRVRWRSTCNSVTCRTERKYGREQGELKGRKACITNEETSHRMGG
jgi:hypothetical protein